jgi:hypothetical protein
MRVRLLSNECWVHVFEEITFSGSVRRLVPGETEVATRVGSVIVGPAAIVNVLNRHGRQIMILRPRKIVEDFAMLASKKDVSSIRVAKQQAIKR